MEKDISNLLKDFEKTTNKTLYKLAKELDIPVNTLYRYRNKNVSPGKLTEDFLRRYLKENYDID